MNLAAKGQARRGKKEATECPQGGRAQSGGDPPLPPSAPVSLRPCLPPCLPPFVVSELWCFTSAGARELRKKGGVV